MCAIPALCRPSNVLWPNCRLPRRLSICRPMGAAKTCWWKSKQWESKSSTSENSHERQQNRRYSRERATLSVERHPEGTDEGRHHAPIDHLQADDDRSCVPQKRRRGADALARERTDHL